VATCGCSKAGSLGEYEAARTLHLAPDGRLVVTDLGSGEDDGTVMAVDAASGKQTVLLHDLPSDQVVYPVSTDGRNSAFNQTGIGETDIFTSVERH
jgi:hypothetical protein